MFLLYFIYSCLYLRLHLSHHHNHHRSTTTLTHCCHCSFLTLFFSVMVCFLLVYCLSRARWLFRFLNFFLGKCKFHLFVFFPFSFHLRFPPGEVLVVSKYVVRTIMVFSFLFLSLLNFLLNQCWEFGLIPGGLVFFRYELPFGWGCDGLDRLEAWRRNSDNRVLQGRNSG